MTFVVNIFFTLFLLIFSLDVGAGLLPCLGREELAIHRSKKQGAVYHLNQFFVNQLAKEKKKRHLSVQYRERICGEQVSSPSVALLKHLLLYGDRIFVYSPSDSSSIREDAYKAFFIFLLKIQESAPRQECLEKHLPHYNYFMDRRKHLQEEDLPPLKEKKKILEIFKIIERPNVLLSKCQKNQ